MKKILFVCALMISALAMAQQPACQHNGNHCKGNGHQCQKETPQTMAIHKAVKYRDALRLNEKQFNKVYKIYLADFTVMQSDSNLCCKGKKEMTKEQCQAKKEAMKRITESRQAKMKKILDEAQYALWMEMDKPCCHQHKACPQHKEGCNKQQACQQHKEGCNKQQACQQHTGCQKAR